MAVLQMLEEVMRSREGATEALFSHLYLDIQHSFPHAQGPPCMQSSNDHQEIPSVAWRLCCSYNLFGLKNWYLQLSGA